MATNELRWYQMTTEQVFEELDTDNKGLTSDEAANRLKQYGYNELEYKKPSVIMRFLRQFHNPLVYILLAAAIITSVLTVRGEDMLADTIVIVGVVVLNAIIGFFQEGQNRISSPSK